MSPKISIDLTNHRLEQANEDLEDARMLYHANSFKGANNRAYYSIFHTIRAVLALEPIDFKKHKDVVAYFNKNYISTEIFPRQLGKRIMQAKRIREDSDYDDEYVANQEATKAQIDTAEELISLVENYIKNKIK